MFRPRGAQRTRLLRHSRLQPAGIAAVREAGLRLTDGARGHDAARSIELTESAGSRRLETASELAVAIDRFAARGEIRARRAPGVYSRKFHTRKRRCELP